MEESQALWLGAIEKEKMLVTFLFGIISIVAIFLIFCIFYMIVVEKTRDIGSSSLSARPQRRGGNLPRLWLGDRPGRRGFRFAGRLDHRPQHQLHPRADGQAAGVQIWNPEVYAFDTIPNTMNPMEVTVICSIAIIASVVGSLIPALRAAQMNPVEALRWE
jgi:lipoprotein-releasing system permease protein